MILYIFLVRSSGNKKENRLAVGRVLRVGYCANGSGVSGKDQFHPLRSLIAKCFPSDRRMLIRVTN